MNPYFDWGMKLYYALGAGAMVLGFFRWMWRREQFIDVVGKNHLPHIERYLKLLCEKQGIPYEKWED